MRKSALLAFCFVSTAAMGSIAQAQLILDMSKVRCEQLVTASPDAVDAAVWLSGYYNEIRRNTQLDFGQFKKNAESEIAACQKDPQNPVMKIIEEMLAKQKLQRRL